MTEKFDADELMAEASARSGGLTDVGDGAFHEPMKLLVDSLEAEGNLNEFGRFVAQERVMLHAVNRLNYVNDRTKYPEIAVQKIEKPVFIIGFPRTGTTILHDILAQDPDTRAPLTWESMFPSPPPEAATFHTDARIEMCASLFPAADIESESDRKFRAMHPMGPLLTQECVVLMGETMCSPLFHNQFRVPSYMDWVDHEADWAHVYDFHHRQLQHLQSRAPRLDRWVLKTGAHMWGLEHLLATYPDARIVFTHRDPVRSVTSFASLTCHVRKMSSDEVDPPEVAHDWARRLQRVVQRTLDVRDSNHYPDAIFYDMYFSDFVADQFAVVSDIYRALGLPMTEQAATRMKAFIDDNPKGKHGLHTYTPEEYGLVPEEIREQFQSYIDHFRLPPE